MTRLVLLLFFCVLAQAGDLHIVAQAGGGDFVDIQAAIDAAADGDVILVKDGTYDGFEVIGKALSVVADEGHEVRVRQLSDPGADHTCTVGGTSPSQQVLLSGLRQDVAPDQIGGILVDACAGEVLIVDCHMPNSNVHEWWPPTAVNEGLRVQASPYVTATHGLFRGSPGMDVCDTGTHGADGIAFVDAGGALYHATATGGDGGYGFKCGFACDTPGGDGGHGLGLWGADLFTHALAAAGGAAGYSDCFLSGAPGLPVWVDGSSRLREAKHPKFELVMDRARRENLPLAVTCRGKPGEVAFLLSAGVLRARPFRPKVGVLHLRTPVAFVPLGTFDASGALSVEIPAPDLPPGEAARVVYYQLYTPLANGGRVFSNPTATAVYQ